MFCEACGTDNAPTARFCLNCGSGLGEHCRNCAAELPPRAHFCPACGHATALPAKPGPSLSERKQVTVLFADFSGFTAFADKLDPEELRDHMTSLWTRLDSVIKARGGIIEKHI